MPERERKAGYAYVAKLLGEKAHPPELQRIVKHIRAQMDAAGRQPELFAFDQLVAAQPPTE